MATPVTWLATADAVVVGTGVAGLTCASDLAAGGLKVLVITKTDPEAGSTRWAQGGIADPAEGAALAGHIEDTLVAGAGLCDIRATTAILEAGSAAIRRLIRRGARFDAGQGHPDGLARTLEGGHGLPRIIHAGGDATGAEVERVLAAQSALPPLLTDHLAVDLLLTDDGSVGGLLVLDNDGRLGEIRCRAVVLATGGSSQLYASGTNPEVATADGVAMALRAGADLVDMEFIQFHPTALWTPGARGRRPLVTEALRGAGAMLIDGAGRPVMTGVHPLGDLAPRDVVSLAITRRLAEKPGGIGDHVFLDASTVSDFDLRFPTVAASCRMVGVPVIAIPVSPAAHYQCGGIAVDHRSRSTLAGLWAVGEAAGTGLHGANRLASNSLLEGLVTGEAAAADILRTGPVPVERVTTTPATTWIDPVHRRAVQDAMTAAVGIGRTAAGLADAGRTVAADPGAGPLDRASVEVTNVAQVASAVITAAALRRESRGCHVRLDHPEHDTPFRLRIRRRGSGLSVRPSPVTGPSQHADTVLIPVGALG